MDPNMKSKLGDGVKVEMVTEDQMTDADREAVFNREQTVDAIPDVDELSWNVFKILEYLEEEKTQKIMEKNSTAIRMLLNNKYADKVPLGIIDMLMEEEFREENVARVLQIIEYLRQAKLYGNEKLKELDGMLTEEVNQRYLYSKHGGSKEAFERALAQEVRKEQSKKNGQNNQSEMKNFGKLMVNN